MTLKFASTEHAPGAIGPYSQAVVANGCVYCSGQIALDPQTGKLIEADLAGETARALANLRAVLAAAGSDVGSVVKTTVYLTDLGEFAAMNRAYSEFFGDHKPARVTVEVAALPAGARVEIDCVAIGDRSRD